MTSASVLQRRRAERQARLDLAGRWAEALAGRVALKAAVVFGSVARGDFNKWSDIDVLVVSDDLPPGLRERLELLSEAVPPGIEPVGWTSSELQERRRRRDPIAIEADRCGVVVAGSLQSLDPDHLAAGGEPTAG